MSSSRQPVPPLSLDRDGYEIHTVINIGWAGYTAWVLLWQSKYFIEEVATGWGRGFEPQRRHAYEAMKQHKADIAARDGAA